MEDTPEFKASVKVWQYCPPFLFVFGTFGNVMTVVILRRMNMKRSAMPVYLTALAVSDTCLLYTGLLRRWVMNVFDLDFRTLHSAVCKLHTWLVYAVTIVSAWILMFMTVERAISVWKPHHVSLLCTRKKAAVIVVGIVVFSLVANAHLLYGVDVMDVGNGTKVCFAPDEDYLYFFDAVWSWADLTLASLLPFTVLLIGNTLILWKVSLSARAARYLGSVRPDDVMQRKKTTSSMTITLVALSIIFFFLTSPVCVYNIIEHYVEEELEKNPSARGSAKLRLAWAAVNVLMYTNSTVNFYLYCLSGAKFRQELRRTLCCISAPLWRPSQKHTFTSHNGNHHHHLDCQDSRRCQKNGKVAADGSLKSNCSDTGSTEVIDSVSLRIHNRVLQSDT
ncbi:cysteinyl leukotriene receptor 1-like [Littorina saxatilis]|uniref:G-protein coupled receptors family 1 profile domain-containing protein n=1 Tax=Littorina saxatilis TaxID=31220 RepID=A0AAN9BF66_9CAEN